MGQEELRRIGNCNKEYLYIVGDNRIQQRNRLSSLDHLINQFYRTFPTSGDVRFSFEILRQNMSIFGPLDRNRVYKEPVRLWAQLRRGKGGG